MYSKIFVSSSLLSRDTSKAGRSLLTWNEKGNSTSAQIGNRAQCGLLFVVLATWELTNRMWSQTWWQVKRIVKQRHHMRISAHIHVILIHCRTFDGWHILLCHQLSYTKGFVPGIVPAASAHSVRISVFNKKIPSFTSCSGYESLRQVDEGWFRLMGSKNFAWVAGFFFWLRSIAVRWMSVIENIKWWIKR